MPNDPDANTLHNKEENDFTRDMLDGMEELSSPSFKPTLLIDRAAFIKDLDQRMQKADWYFEYSDDHSVWPRGLKEIDDIKNDLHTLSVQPNGLTEANLLWELHVPPLSIDKPSYLNIPAQKQFDDEGFAPLITNELQKSIGRDFKQSQLNGWSDIEGKDDLFKNTVKQDEYPADKMEAVGTELEARIEKINWKNAYYDPLEQNVEVEDPTERKLMFEIWKIVEDMQDLATSGPDGMKQVVQLQDKYWKGTPMEEREITKIPNLFRSAIYSLELNSEQSQSIKSNVMSENVNEENYQYLSKQLKYTGFGESLQPALKEAMQKSIQEGKKEFTLGYVPDFDKEKTVATLQFKQSDSSDRFFFNRFNVVVKNDKFPDGVTQGFNVQGYDRKNENITLKAAYNLTDGRPAMVTKQDANKEQFSAWGKLDFSKQKANGDFQMQLFNKNYGFDLEKVLGNYPIKELQTPSYKEGLNQSLERGNLQSVTFQAGGKEEKLFISPDLKMGALKVYDAEKKLIKSEVLLEKQFINKDFGNQLIQRIEAIKEKQEGLKQEAPKQELQKQEGQKPKVKMGGVNEKNDKPPRQRQRKKIS